MAQFDEQVGLSLVRAFHLNDCKGPLGCRVDRHEDIGKGQMGLAGFECLVNDRSFHGVPGMLETEDGHQQANLAALRALAR
jgi:deoxyribonuclease-4